MGGSFGSWLTNFCKKSLTNVAISWARDNLPELVSNLASNAMNKFAIKIRGKGAVRQGKRFDLFISNDDMNDIIKIMKSLEGTDVLSNDITETVK